MKNNNLTNILKYADIYAACIIAGDQRYSLDKAKRIFGKVSASIYQYVLSKVQLFYSNKQLTEKAVRTVGIINQYYQKLAEAKNNFISFYNQYLKEPNDDNIEAFRQAYDKYSSYRLQSWVINQLQDSTLARLQAQKVDLIKERIKTTEQVIKLSEDLQNTVVKWNQQQQNNRIYKPINTESFYAGITNLQNKINILNEKEKYINNQMSITIDNIYKNSGGQ